MLYEIGIFKNQNLIIHEQYYALKKVQPNFTSSERSSLINLIVKVLENILERNIVSFANETYRLFFVTTPKEEEVLTNRSNLFIYAICDFNADSSIILSLLKKLYAHFLKVFVDTDNDNIVDVSQYESFTHQVESVLHDERLSPIDRVKVSLFKGSVSSFKKPQLELE